MLMNVFSWQSIAQNKNTQKEVKQINLLHADILLFDNVSGPGAQRLRGHVKAEHDGSILKCDSAYLYNDNSIDAFGHVHINVNDSLDIYGDQLFYDGNTKIAELHQNVRLIDKKATLFTDDLVYDRKTSIGRYYVWGRIEDSVNVLTSKRGYYYNQIETVYFKDSVVVVNPDYVMQSDTLKYQTSTERVFFTGPTIIEGDSSFMYAERGFHDTHSKESRLSQNAFVQNKTNILRGDSIFFSKVLNVSEAFRNVVMIDTANDVYVTGEHAVYDKNQLFAYMVDSAQAIFADKEDSTFLHADTLLLKLDSLESPKEIHAFYNMKFFSKSAQGMADSLVYVFSDSSLQLFGKPFLWFEENQISCERIDLISEYGQLDSAAFQQNVFLVSQDTVDPRYFNQVSGSNMYAWFREGDLRKIFMSAKSETITFLWEEDGSPIGLNKLQSTDMLIFVKDQQLETITYINKPTAYLKPLDLVSPSEEKLKGFVWMQEWRPMKREDIFRKKAQESTDITEEDMN